MTLQELINEANYRLSLLEKSTIEPDAELLFLREFDNASSVANIETISEIDECDIFLAYLTAKTNFQFETLRERIENIRPLVNDPNMTQEKLRNVFCGMISNCNFTGPTEQAIKTNKIVRKIKESIQDKKIIGILKNNNLSEKYLSSAKSIIELILFINSDIITGYSFDDEVPDELSDRLKQRLDIFADAFILMGIVKSTREICNGTNHNITLVDDNDNVTTIYDESISKKDKKYIHKQVSKLPDYKVIATSYQIISKYHQEKESKLNKIIKGRNKKAQQYRNFITSLEKISLPSEITSYQTSLEFLPDEDLKLEFLRYVYENNLREGTKLQEEYHKTFSKERETYARVLSKHSLPNSEEFLDCVISRYTEEELKTILEDIGKLGITDIDSIYQVLSTSTSKTISTLCSLTKKEIIPKDFYKTHLSIFSSESSIYKTALTNINSFTDSGINPKYLFLNPSILLTDSTSLKRSIELLKDENLLGSIKKDSDISFLTSSDLEERVNTMMFANCYGSVSDNIDLLNYSSTRWKRVVVMQTIDMPVAKEDLSAFLDRDDFFIPDSKIDSYIPAIPKITKPSTK